MPELCWHWSGGKGLPTGCLSGPLNILVLWEERQGREAGFWRRVTLLLAGRPCHSGGFIALGLLRIGRGSAQCTFYKTHIRTRDFT